MNNTVIPVWHVVDDDVVEGGSYELIREFLHINFSGSYTEWLWPERTFTRMCESDGDLSAICFGIDEIVTFDIS